MLSSTEIQGYLAFPDDTIEEAWSKIESNRHRSLIIVDGSKIVGTLSDGDLRKAMLSRRLLSTPVKELMNVNFIFVFANERRRAKDIFREKDIFLIPVVDDRFNLLDIIMR